MIEEKNKSYIKIIVIILSICILGIGGFFIYDKVLNKEKPPVPTPTPKQQNNNNNNNQNVVSANNDFSVKLIKEVNTKANKSNYLISPYNIELALNMLREGADGNTKTELDNVLGSRTINNISGNNVKIANGLFIKEALKDSVKKDYVNILKTKYNSELVYDKLNTPEVVNNWAKEKTNGMIKKVLDRLSPNTILVLASALSMDVKWTDQFDCNSTRSSEFTKLDGNKINVEMMHKEYETSEYKYIKTNDSLGIVIPYESESNTNLEFIGLLPTNGIDSFINSLTNDKLNELLKNSKEAGNKTHINLSLPRFTYDYELEDFIGILKSLGIKDVFDEKKANLSKMINLEEIENAFVDQATHNTRIELSETGTKASAVTSLVVVGKGMNPDDIETIDVNFNKPFIYMIRERNTNEILFFGAVYEPNTWNGSTCSK